MGGGGSGRGDFCGAALAESGAGAADAGGWGGDVLAVRAGKEYFAAGRGAGGFGGAGVVGGSAGVGPLDEGWGRGLGGSLVGELRLRGAGAGRGGGREQPTGWRSAIE